MATELGNLKRWCWDRVWSHLTLRETLDTSILKLSSAYRGEDSGVCYRGLMERRFKYCNLKFIVPAALSHVCRNLRWSWESAMKQLHDNVGEVVRLWRPSWGEVRNDSNRWRRCVVHWTVFIRWTPVRKSSEVNERLRIATSFSTAGLPSFPPLLCVERCQHVYYCVYCYCFIFTDLCSFIKLSFLYLLVISQIIHSLQGNHTVAVRLVFAD